MPTVEELKREITCRLTAGDIELAEAGREAELIIEHTCGLTAAQQILRANQRVNPEQYLLVKDILNRREKHVPLQYCLGYAYFMGLKLSVAPGVLIPRQDTECLVAYAVSRLKGHSSPELVDIGTGSGAIAIAMLKALPEATILAIDISAQAIQLARENALSHQVAGRLHLVLGDWLGNLPQFADVILANPPYIPRSQAGTLAPEILLYEPQEALFGQGDDGLLFYRQVSKAGQHIREGGFIAVEVGDNQAQGVADIFCRAGWQQVEVHHDVNNLPRVVSAMPVFK